MQHPEGTTPVASPPLLLNFSFRKNITIDADQPRDGSFGVAGRTFYEVKWPSAVSCGVVFPTIIKLIIFSIRL
jgi:hypothetical protein